ncbi:hypothetical protein CEUSTIGMA_g881.t1 [Chlamydomonas eustigma]|uniref:Uncharacterized protein n=1 Tax=Chlamydomonas eustigma TaxID=1157962 RepID=A0A250WRV4_9CHLO|nr:hypothetical protein CEUSTIGMA_g881.t1 [Chlamydomonas eustigma]|eukprot:GAX73429.1 hypothetical protein CEUSTIGMA_g881.t1 [Chlamydomonas eustigma]
MSKLRLTEQFNDASKSVHSISNLLVNSRLLVLFTQRQLYARAIACFYFVFKALEDALIVAFERDKSIGSLKEVIQPLFRAQAFEEDLIFYLGPHWRSQVQRSAAIVAYEERIKHLLETDPRLLLAHVYTQHLAMAAGGQIIKRMARKQMQLEDGHGTAAYEYPEGRPSASELKSALKTKIDEVGTTFSEEVCKKLVEEHCLVFKYNNEIITAFRIRWQPFLKGLWVLCTSQTAVKITVAVLIPVTLGLGYQLMSR